MPDLAADFPELRQRVLWQHHVVPAVPGIDLDGELTETMMRLTTAGGEEVREARALIAVTRHSALLRPSGRLVDLAGSQTKPADQLFRRCGLRTGRDMLEGALPGRLLD